MKGMSARLMAIKTAKKLTTRRVLAREER